MTKRLCAVIVNYNTAELTRDCIASLLPQIDPGKDYVVVVDNASNQTDLEQLSNYCAQLDVAGIVKVLALPDNNGFSAGNNAGISSCQAENYLLTNSDTLFHVGAIAALLAATKSYPDAGIISPQLEWPDGKVQVSCFRYHSPASQLIHSANTGAVTKLLRKWNVPLKPLSEPSSPDWTSFACVLVRKAVIDRAGLLDDRFFMYYEDTDYCRRTRNAGFDIINIPDARVIHLQGKSSDVGKRTVLRKSLPVYYYNSRARYYTKHYGACGLLLANVFWISGRMVSLLRQGLGNMGRPVPDREFFNIWKQH